ncbi:sigma-54-dependent Fis family transcriptional regulator [Ideonella sp. A 288]|uniref:sigma-54 interaction domain-containing protein n=1 Tax=Ideonella sp. A 288 TaxID=1962181 RepID=UPI000B4B8CA6|nr:sigma-54-dependent Fis family transcriptional regulator [Ideonella sp. A 288]
MPRAKSPAPAGLLPELVSYLEGLPEPHILFDRHYRILAANAAYRQAHGGPVPVVGRTCHEVSHHFSVPCDQAGESCPLARARESGQRERVMHLHHTPQGEAYVDIELVPLRDAQGELSYFIEKMAPLRVAHGRPAVEGLIGRAPAFRQMLELVARVGPSGASVLLLGESGTGKELVAHALHEASPRVARPLVVVDCASLTESLFESELFGHERGAFTGAAVARTGLAEAANGGTLFLDEVGDIPLPMQVKLLRLLESGTYRRVGSTELRHTDLRVVSATHRDLRAMVADGRFREDLYHRLGTFPIHVPALRERADDIPLLAAALLARVAPQRRLSLSAAALAHLRQQPFPGNVRELRNVLERASLLCDGAVIELAHVDRALGAGGPVSAVPSPVPRPGSPAPPASEAARAMRPLRELEREALRAGLAAHGGSRADLARTLGISERTLYRKLKALGDGA